MTNNEKNSNEKISDHRDKAEVIDRNLVDARIWESRNVWRLQQILQLKKRNGNWIVLQSVAWLLARKPFIVPIPGTTNLKHLAMNLASLQVALTAEDVNELDKGFTQIGVQGFRTTPALQQRHDMGVDLGTSSKGKNGNSTLPKK